MPRSHPGRAKYSHGLVPACRTSPDPLRCFSRNSRESTPFTFQNCLACVRLIAFGTPCDTCAGIHRICRLKKENEAESNTDSSVAEREELRHDLVPQESDRRRSEATKRLATRGPRLAVPQHTSRIQLCTSNTTARHNRLNPDGNGSTHQATFDRTKRSDKNSK